MKAMRLILSDTIDVKSAGLLLYALQTASLNLRRTDLEPIMRQRFVIDPDAVHETSLDERAWEVEDFEDEVVVEEELADESLDRHDAREEAREDEDEDEEPDGEDDDDDEEEDDDDEDEPPLYVRDDALHSGRCV